MAIRVSVNVAVIPRSPSQVKSRPGLTASPFRYFAAALQLVRGLRGALRDELALATLDTIRAGQLFGRAPGRATRRIPR